MPAGSQLTEMSLHRNYMKHSRQNWIQTRVTLQELAVIDSAAKSFGLDRSEFIRSVAALLDACRSPCKKETMIWWAAQTTCLLQANSRALAERDGAKEVLDEISHRTLLAQASIEKIHGLLIRTE